MGHTIGDALIVAAIVAGFIAYWYIRHLERQRRLEIIHQERLVAMEKGIPLPELPLDPLKVPKPSDPRGPLIHGIVWAAFGGGAMLALRLMESRPALAELWPLPLPLALLGAGLIIYYILASERGR